MAGCQISLQPLKGFIHLQHLISHIFFKVQNQFQCFCRTLKAIHLAMSFKSSSHCPSIDQALVNKKKPGTPNPACVLLLLLPIVPLLKSKPLRSSTGTTAAVSLPLITLQNCQYEMILEEAGPELAALICRFPEELDLLM